MRERRKGRRGESREWEKRGRVRKEGKLGKEKRRRGKDR